MLEKAIVSFYEATAVKLLRKPEFNFNNWCSVQVGENLIFQALSTMSRCRMLTCDNNNAFSYTEVSTFSVFALVFHSMCGVNSKFVYVTGG